jgi:hypothetical protein
LNLIQKCATSASGHSKQRRRDGDGIEFDCGGAYRATRRRHRRTRPRIARLCFRSDLDLDLLFLKWFFEKQTNKMQAIAWLKQAMAAARARESTASNIPSFQSAPSSTTTAPTTTTSSTSSINKDSRFDLLFELLFITKIMCLL